MTNDTQRPAVNIKQRIIGAVVLIALLVIIMPSLLDLRKDYDLVVSGSNIPPKPDDFRVEVLQFDEDAEIKVPAAPAEEIVISADAATAGPGEKKIAPDAASAGQADTQERFNEMRNRINDSKDGSVAKAGQAAAEAWVVQLASLTRKQNALALRDRVLDKGLHAFVVSSEADGKVMYRVLVGPELLRSNAEKKRQRLLQEVNLDGLVVKYRR